MRSFIRGKADKKNHLDCLGFVTKEEDKFQLHILHSPGLSFEVYPSSTIRLIFLIFHRFKFISGNPLEDVLRYAGVNYGMLKGHQIN